MGAGQFSSDVAVMQLWRAAAGAEPVGKDTKLSGRDNAPCRERRTGSWRGRDGRQRYAPKRQTVRRSTLTNFHSTALNDDTIILHHSALVSFPREATAGLSPSMAGVGESERFTEAGRSASLFTRGSGRWIVSGLSFV
jgi:hypothetical protein